MQATTLGGRGWARLFRDIPRNTRIPVFLIPLNGTYDGRFVCQHSSRRRY